MTDLNFEPLLPLLETREEKALWLYILATDPEAATIIEQQTLPEHGLMVARLHLAAWLESRKARPDSEPVNLDPA